MSVLPKRMNFRELSLTQRLGEPLCSVWGDFNYASRKAPTSLCYRGDDTLISSVWEKVPQMFVMRWLLAAAAAAFYEHVNQPVSVCLPICLLVSHLSLIIRGAGISAVQSHSFFTSPSFSFYALTLLQNFWNIRVGENSRIPVVRRVKGCEKKGKYSKTWWKYGQSFTLILSDLVSYLHINILKTCSDIFW